jgi:hypothetical protein
MSQEAKIHSSIEKQKSLTFLQANHSQKDHEDRGAVVAAFCNDRSSRSVIRDIEIAMSCFSFNHYITAKKTKTQATE